MNKIAVVKTGKQNNVYWFDPGNLNLNVGDKVIAKTSHGDIFGEIVQEVFSADEAQLKSLNSELKPIKRLAKDIDFARYENLDNLESKAMPIFRQLANKYNKEMNPLSVEYNFSGTSAFFYFTAPSRQDFRTLIDKLSTKLNIKVFLKQINERQKSKIIGGVGICGRELCCKKLNRCPKKVSMKMAKTQNLSLNPETLNGCCGKLMCCLSYESKNYEDFNTTCPKLKSVIKTPEGDASVVDISMPRETVQIKYSSPEKRIRVPLSYIEKSSKKKTSSTDSLDPYSINKKNWEKLLESEKLKSGLTNPFFMNNVGSIKSNDNEVLLDATSNKLPSNNLKNAQNKQQNKHKNKVAKNLNKLTKGIKKRRSRKLAVDDSIQLDTNIDHNLKSNKKVKAEQKTDFNKSENYKKRNIKKRPGRRSSGLSDIR